MQENFQRLWDGSRTFRTLFIRIGVFKSAADVDLGKAEVFWHDRWPRVQWDLCGHEGCSALVMKGHRCRRHDPESPLPLWQWDRGTLYALRSSKEYLEKGVNVHERRYTAYPQHVAKGMFGEIPAGYTIQYLDGNPFNLRRANLVIISKVMAIAMREGEVNISTAIQLDDVMEDKLRDLCGFKRPKSAWVYTVDAIAEAAGIKAARVRQEISRGSVDPSSLDSVINFCQEMKGITGESLPVVRKIG